MEKDQPTASPRRKFLGTIAAGAAAIGLSTFVSPLAAHAGKLIPSENGHTDPMDPDAWFNQIKGKHRIVYDVPAPKEGHDLIMPFAWSKVFLLTNAATGTPEKDCNVVMILRHSGIAFAMEDRLWKKYKFGEVFNIKDPGTGAASVRNMMWKPNPAFSIPGVGPVPIGIDDLQASGVMFCVCDMALTVFSAVVADATKLNKDDVKKDWLSGLLPGVQVVPSGVWAVGRAQEHKCAYCLAG
jgi:intracellular sulfur oxidation DsrE/DsrF family protein